MNKARQLQVLSALTLWGCISESTADRNGLARELASCAPLDASTPKVPSCDLSGRWIMSELGTGTALGATSSRIGWHYLEITQQGDELTMSKTLYCGEQTVQLPGNLASAIIDESAAWPAYLQRTNYNGRKGVSRPQLDGCSVFFERASLVAGMTVAAYADESVPLPTLSQPASSSTPGWEDWDNDGYPGITLKLSGLASGEVYAAYRTSTTSGGSIASGATSFELNYAWIREHAIYGSNPASSVLTAVVPWQRGADDTPNLVQLARLADDQAVGNDEAKCAAIRSLAPTLNPAANPP